ncbi:uncharacterized protein LOC143594667 [Bidens hawaiensis]|uniref:uncharacterized protein LOC143594667 n=1 Tax=Bidens hawaiensis TaxID=980011 RepID=UPI0040497980
MAAMKKDVEGFSEKEKVYVKRIDELSRGHEIEMAGLKKAMEADKAKLSADREAFEMQKRAFEIEKEGLKASVTQTSEDNKWLIEHGFQQVVSYLLHSKEFNSVLGDVYTKLLVHGKHLGFIAGFHHHETGQPMEQSPLFNPEAYKLFTGSVHAMERLTYPYVGVVSSCYGKPLSVLQGLKPAGLDEKVSKEVIESLSRKRSRSGDSEETLSGGSNGSHVASLEGSAVADVVPQVKKSGKAKGGKASTSKPVSDV